MHFEIIGDIEDVETLAVGGRIRDIMRIRKQFGPGRWRKLKGRAKFDFKAEGCAVPRCTGMKPTVSVGRK